MASGNQITVRELAKKIKANTQDVITALGVANGNVLVDENQAIAKLRAASSRSGEAPDNGQEQNGSSDMSGSLFADSNQAIAESIDKQSVQAALLAAEQYKASTFQYLVNVPAEVVRAKADEMGVTQASNPFDGLNVTKGFSTLNNMIAGTGMRLPALAAGESSPPSNSNPPLDQEPELTPLSSGSTGGGITSSTSQQPEQPETLE